MLSSTPLKPRLKLIRANTTQRSPTRRCETVEPGQIGSHSLTMVYTRASPSVEIHGQIPALVTPPGGWSAAAHSADSDGELGVDVDELCDDIQLPALNRTLQPEFVEAEQQAALHLPNFLSEGELLQVIAVADSMSGVEFCRSDEADSERSVFGHDVSFSTSHVALNLHRDRHFARVVPVLMKKIVQGMRSHPDHWCDPSIALNVRCVEYHTYYVGDGLMTCGHKDYGSVLSMSTSLLKVSGSVTNRQTGRLPADRADTLAGC